MQGLATPRVSGDGMVLRRATVEDAPIVAAAVAANLDHLAPWMPWATAPAATLAAQRERLTAAQRSGQLGEAYEFLACDADTGVLLGVFGLHRRIGVGAVELGYWLCQDAVGRGYATRAAGALSRAALELSDVERVEIHCDEANVASQRVPRRLGYRLDRVVPIAVTAPGEVGRRMIWVWPAGHPRTEGVDAKERG